MHVLDVDRAIREGRNLVQCKLNPMFGNRFPDQEVAARPNQSGVQTLSSPADARLHLASARLSISLSGSLKGLPSRIPGFHGSCRRGTGVKLN
jgi:hypothetical protein